MTQPLRPSIRFLSDETVRDALDEARRVLDEVGVLVEHGDAVALLSGAGARVEAGRVRIAPELVERALATAPREVTVWDRAGADPVRLGAGSVTCFDPGSAAIKVWDAALGAARPSTAADCERFARLTDQLPSIALQSTCVVPTDVPRERADRVRLALALRHGRKGAVTGTFEAASFEPMRRMLVAVRGTEAALREKPLAIFDCCPSSPLTWSELTCGALVACARAGIPAELVSMPMTGATAPVTLLGAVVQHAAEVLSGLVIAQLAAPGAPVIWGGSSAAFDMRTGTPPMGAIETMMIDAATAELGGRLGLPTHAYLAMSDAKVADYQAGLETGMGALVAALSGVSLASGPGFLDFESCQSLEKLVLDAEACAMALRAVRGIERRDDVMALETIREGLAAEGSFLALGHTRRWFRAEHRFPGPVIDRTVGEVWATTGGKRTAFDRARDEVAKLLAKDPPALPLPEEVLRALDELARLPRSSDQ